MSGADFTIELPEPVLAKRYARNERGRDLIVGDIHGCFSKLEAALAEIEFNPAFDRLFSVGDLVDRGSESHRALEFLAQPWFIAVQGNHEEMNAGLAVGLVPESMCAANGGLWNVENDLPTRLKYAAAFTVLPVAIELETTEGPVGIVHACCPRGDWPAFFAALQGPVTAESRHLIEQAMWRHAKFTDELGFVSGVRAVVVGHTPVQQLTSLDNTLFIDTKGWKPGGSFCILDAATLRRADRPSRLIWTE